MRAFSLSVLTALALFAAAPVQAAPLFADTPRGWQVAAVTDVSIIVVDPGGGERGAVLPRVHVLIVWRNPRPPPAAGQPPAAYYDLMVEADCPAHRARNARSNILDAGLQSFWSNPNAGAWYGADPGSNGNLIVDGVCNLLGGKAQPVVNGNLAAVRAYYDGKLKEQGW